MSACCLLGRICSSSCSFVSSGGLVTVLKRVVMVYGGVIYYTHASLTSTSSLISTFNISFSFTYHTAASSSCFVLFCHIANISL